MTDIHDPSDDPSDDPSRDPAVDPGDGANELAQALTEMVDHIGVSAALRERVERDLRSKAAARTGLPRRRLLAAAAVLAVVVAGAAAVMAMEDGDAVVTVADDPDSPPSTPPPTVAGIVIERPEGDGSATTTTAAAVPAVPAAPPATSPQATTATTALVCRNSFDPACGDFSWDPEPVVGQSTVRLDVPGGPLRVGSTYEIVVELTDPTAPPTFNCGSVNVSPTPAGGWVGGFSCVVEPAPVCAARYGPWTPPAPSGGTITERVPVTFEEPGPHTISVETRTPPKHCYQPYGSDAATSITVEVLAG